MSALSTSALDTDDDPEEDTAQHQDETQDQVEPLPSTHAFEAATRLGRRLSDAVLASPSDTSPPARDTNGADGATTHFSSADGDIAAQLFAHPKLAAFRAPGMMMSPMSPISPMSLSPPILMNPKCSGYFVEPVRLSLRSGTQSQFLCLSLDEVDGAAARVGADRRQDHLPEQKVRCEAG
jgi:dual specificity phosphatase 12